MRQIITHFTDNDLYTFTCQYYILMNYPHAEVEYSFFDRNKTKYPLGFGDMLREQMSYMKNVRITDEEIDFMKKSCYYLPDWYFNFLRGYTFNPNEVTISQDNEGYLDIKISGKWWSTIMWEMPILSSISELMHFVKADDKKIDMNVEYTRARLKARKLLNAGIKFADMGTRRRFSVELQDIVIKAFKDESDNFNETIHLENGNFNGTSNVYFAMKYNLKPIGTMSHQIISFEEIMTSITECNYSVMDKWCKTYDGSLGIFLYDCFGDKVFFNNLSRKYAMLYDGLRVDSGDNMEQLCKIAEKYNSLNIMPITKKVVFSNGLNGDEAISLHKEIHQRVDDSYGIGTWFTCGFDEISFESITVPSVDVKPMNIVIKLTKGRYSDRHSWQNCVKLSCDKGKSVGNSDKCKYLSSLIDNLN